MYKFNRKYFVIAVIIFFIEVYIAIYEHGWIRSYFGDVLVVILIYCAVKSIFNFRVIPTALGVLAFSFLIEFSQYFDLVHLIGWQHNKLAVTVMGNTYHWLDLVSYTAGIIIVISAEYIRGNVKVSSLDK